MSRYDYRDPGADPAYCNAISDDPQREMPRQEICPDCKGDGTKFNHVEGGWLEKVACPECDGKGYYEEAL